MADDQFTQFSYGPDKLQTYEIYFPPHEAQHSPKPSKPWLVFIHGGYFRDAAVTAASVRESVKQLDPVSYAAVASVNYRLSLRSGDAESNAEVPRWPDHAEDVLAALRDLQSRHDIGRRYVLSGHSVGAQMAFYAALRTLGDESIPKPAAVLGVSGIYDYVLIHRTNPDYAQMTLAAMAEGDVAAASSALTPAGTYNLLPLTAVVLAHSRDDGLVGWDQLEAMERVMNSVACWKGKTKVVELQGAHNQIWEGGVQLAKAFAETLDML